MWEYFPDQSRPIRLEQKFIPPGELTKTTRTSLWLFLTQVRTLVLQIFSFNIMDQVLTLKEDGLHCTVMQEIPLKQYHTISINCLGQILQYRANFYLSFLHSSTYQHLHKFWYPHFNHTCLQPSAPNQSYHHSHYQIRGRTRTRSQHHHSQSTQGSQPSHSYCLQSSNPHHVFGNHACFLYLFSESGRIPNFLP